MEEEILKKFYEIRSIMQAVSGSRKRQTVGIVDDDIGHNDLWWLCEALTSEYFSEVIKDIGLFTMSDIGTKLISSCTFNIFLCNGYNGKTFPSMGQRVEWKNMIIIIYNLEDSSDREKRRILQENGNCFRYKENIFLFSKKEQGSNFLSHLMDDPSPGSVRSKKKGFFSMFGTTRRNVISINDYRPVPKARSYDSRKGSRSEGRKSSNKDMSSDYHQREPQNMGNSAEKEKNSSAHMIPSKTSRQGQSREWPTIFKRPWSRSEGRKSSKKDMSSDYHQREPQNIGNSAEKEKNSSAHMILSKGQSRERPSIFKTPWFGSVGRKPRRKNLDYNPPEPQDPSYSNSARENVTPTGYASEHIHQRSVINGHRVGIFSRSSDRDFSWLVEMLRSEDFRPHISDVRTLCLSKDTVREFLQEVRECTFGILYQTQKMERNTETTIKYDLELETLHSALGKKNVALLIDDLEDSGERKRSHILDTHRGAAQWIYNLLLVSTKDKKKKKGLKRVMKELKIQMQDSDSIKHKPSAAASLRTFPTYGTGHGVRSSQGRGRKRDRVGIFSRSTDQDYPWLVEMLGSEEFSSLVANVKCCFISNNQNFQEFIDAISQSTFGILYHSKKRGRVNVTNVTDSLYDEELEMLHSILEKKNVVVIIDDLEESDDFRKEGLLQEQPSIADWATDLMLFSENDKKDERIMRQKRVQLKRLLLRAVPESAASSFV